MIVEVASPGRLARAMAVSLALTLFYGWLAFDVVEGLSFWMCLLAAAHAALGFWMAYRLDGARGPLLTLTPAGLVLHDALCERGSIAWEDVRAVRISRVRLYHLFPVAGWLMIRFYDRRLLSPAFRWLPGGWVGAMFVPVRVAAGGAAALSRAAAMARVHIENDKQERALGGVHARRALQPGAETLPLATPALPGDFDPDAALARYMARRPEPAASQPLLNGKPLERNGFGRKRA